MSYWNTVCARLKVAQSQVERRFLAKDSVRFQSPIVHRLKPCTKYHNPVSPSDRFRTCQEQVFLCRLMLDFGRAYWADFHRPLPSCVRYLLPPLTPGRLPRR